MKVLESQPERYDRGIAVLSLGAVGRARRRLVSDCVRSGQRVLEIGCGTGALTLPAARQGAEVVAFDVSAPLLDVARRRLAEAGVADRVRLEERGISAMDTDGDASFDVVLACLVFSELSVEERSYALRHTHRVLRSGGRLAVVDEVSPRGPLRKVLHGLVRIPLTIVTFLLTQTTTHPVDGLPELVSGAGFRVETQERRGLDSLLVLVASKEASP